MTRVPPVTPALSCSSSSSSAAAQAVAVAAAAVRCTETGNPGPAPRLPLPEKRLRAKARLEIALSREDRAPACCVPPRRALLAGTCCACVPKSNYARLPMGDPNSLRFSLRQPARPPHSSHLICACALQSQPKGAWRVGLDLRYSLPRRSPQGVTGRERRRRLGLCGRSLPPLA